MESTGDRAERSRAAACSAPRRGVRCVFLPAVGLAVLLAFVSAARTAPQPETVFRSLAVSGSPAQCGMAHGRALAPQIRQFIALSVRQSGKSRTELHARARRFDAFVRPHHREEMQGIARGAGVDYEDILVLNCWYEMAMMRFACRQVVALSSATASGRLIHGRNLDWVDYGGRLAKNVVVLDCAQTGKNRLILIVWPGMMGSLTGTSDKGLTIAMNLLGLQVEAGEPLFLLMRRALEESENLDEALRILRSAPVTAEGAVVVSGARSDRAACVEWFKGKAATRGPEGGILAADNSPHAGEGTVPQADMVLWKMARGQAGTLTPRAMEGLLNDRRVLLPFNLYSCVFVPEAAEMYIAAGRTPAAGACPFVRVPLFPEP